MVASTASAIPSQCDELSAKAAAYYNPAEFYEGYGLVSLASYNYGKSDAYSQAAVNLLLPRRLTDTGRTWQYSLTKTVRAIEAMSWREMQVLAVLFSQDLRIVEPGRSRSRARQRTPNGHVDQLWLFHQA